jgi:hypothetical protein
MPTLGNNYLNTAFLSRNETSLKKDLLNKEDDLIRRVFSGENKTYEQKRAILDKYIAQYNLPFDNSLNLYVKVFGATRAISLYPDSKNRDEFEQKIQAKESDIKKLGYPAQEGIKDVLRLAERYGKFNELEHTIGKGKTKIIQGLSQRMRDMDAIYHLDPKKRKESINTLTKDLNKELNDYGFTLLPAVTDRHLKFYCVFHDKNGSRHFFEVNAGKGSKRGTVIAEIFPTEPDVFMGKLAKVAFNYDKSQQLFNDKNLYKKDLGVSIFGESQEGETCAIRSAVLLIKLMPKLVRLVRH